MEDRLNRLTCGSCQHDFVYQRAVAVVDFEKSQWIISYPNEGEQHWSDCVRMTEHSFNRCMKIQAPLFIRETVGDWTVRTVFGYPAIREKLVIEEAGFSDVSVETAKLHLQAGRPDWGRATLRLREVLEGRLGWLVGLRNGERILVESDASILEKPLPRGFLPGELGSDAFVDSRRFFVSSRPADPRRFNLAGHDVPAGFPELDPRYG